MCKYLEQTKLLARRRYAVSTASAGGGHRRIQNAVAPSGPHFTICITEHLRVIAQRSVYLDNKVEMVCSCRHHGNKESRNSPMWVVKAEVAGDPRKGKV